LTNHGSNQNEDGTYSWKFDNYTHSGAHLGINYDDLTALWNKIDCPTMLMNARQGFEHRTGQNDTLRYFRQGKVVNIDNAGHWLHHDQFQTYVDESRAFLAGAHQEAK
ncbi:MAG: pimeloyl-ACP methyl ester carboxylesterase, partial [Candidatus Azotimanducaceae bacterium]